MLRGSVWRSGAWVFPCWALAIACAGHQDSGAAGSDCYRDADCKAGLVCVPTPAGPRVCSSDTTPLVSEVVGPPPVEVPPEEMPIEDAGTGEEDAATDPDAGQVTPDPDAGTPDPDAGTPDPDAGAGTPDGG